MRATEGNEASWAGPGLWHAFAEPARRLLGYFEERGLIVVRNDFKGLRIVAFPDLDAETRPGDPNRGEDQPQAAE